MMPLVPAVVMGLDFPWGAATRRGDRGPLSPRTRKRGLSVGRDGARCSMQTVFRRGWKPGARVGYIVAMPMNVPGGELRG